MTLNQRRKSKCTKSNIQGRKLHRGAAGTSTNLAVILEEGYITPDDDGFISLEDVKILSDADGYRLKGLEWDKAFRYAKEDAENLD